MLIITIIAALRNASCGIEYLNAFSDSFVAADLTPLNKTKNVVVFIPPPVEPGEAPMNISTIITTSPASVNPPSGYVQNPAVLAETLWNSAPSQLMFSVSLKSSAPAKISAALVESTTFECTESFFQCNFFSINSLITRNPIPPKNIIAQVTILSHTSFLYGIRLVPLPSTSKPALLNADIE